MCGGGGQVCRLACGESRSGVGPYLATSEDNISLKCRTTC